MIRLTDPTGQEIALDGPAKRIVSLVPSQTEWLAYLGLDEEVVGLTKFCVHPRSWRKKKVIVGGTKNAHPEKILELQPDLVIANKEENTLELVEQLRKETSVYTSVVPDLEAAMKMMVDLGRLTGRENAALSFTDHCRYLSYRIIQRGTTREFARAAYVIWPEPLMVAGAGTFIDALLQQAGWVNAFGHYDRYPAISEGDLKKAQPDRIMLSSEPFPFKEVHVREFARRHPASTVELVDGELFSRYGWRLAKALTILADS